MMTEVATVLVFCLGCIAGYLLALAEAQVRDKTHRDAVHVQEFKRLAELIDADPIASAQLQKLIEEHDIQIPKPR